MDKGSSVVVLDQGLYEKQISFMLSDKTTYRKLSSNLTTLVFNSLDILLQEDIPTSLIQRNGIIC